MYLIGFTKRYDIFIQTCIFYVLYSICKRKLISRKKHFIKLAKLFQIGFTEKYDIFPQTYTFDVLCKRKLISRKKTPLSNLLNCTYLCKSYHTNMIRSDSSWVWNQIISWIIFFTFFIKFNQILTKIQKPGY